MSPPLLNKTNPSREEMSHESDMGSSSSGRANSSPLLTIELQQGNNFIPSKKINGIEKQCCVRCISHANGTCQGAKTYLWHGPAAIFPDKPLHSSAATLMVPFGGRLGAPPLVSEEDKRDALARIRSDNKWCTPAPSGSGSGEVSLDAAASAATVTHEGSPLNGLINPLPNGTKDFRSGEAALEGLIGAAEFNEC